MSISFNIASGCVLEAKQLCKHYGQTIALDNLDLSVQSGEVVALLGANGAGKSTTLGLFLGLLKPTSGAAFVAGQDVAANPERARESLGYLPEVVNLYPVFTGVETLCYFNDAAARPTLSREAAEQALFQVGLQKEAHGRRVSEYSKGMRQKLGLAISLAKQASALLLDEPLSGLDPRAANDLVGLVRELSDQGTTILAVTHDIFRAQQMADRIGIMRSGQLIEMVDANSMSALDIEALYVHHLRDVA